MYLSYSGSKTALTCLYKYWRQYIDKTPVVENGLTSFYGSIVGTVFEDFYQMDLWKQPDVVGALRARVPTALAAAYAGAARQNRPIQWKGDVSAKDGKNLYDNEAELLADVDQGIINGLEVIQEFQLLGPRMGAEVPLDVVVEGHKIGGRADFIISRLRPRDETIILDGKGSKYRDQYTDPVQLKWYAMLYEIRYGKPPNRLGFVFWRYRHLEALQWEPFKVEDLRILLGSTLTLIDTLEYRKRACQAGALPVHAFPPTPCRDNCFLCSYGTKELCPAGAKFHKD
jgi:hypothetical protein